MKFRRVMLILASCVFFATLAGCNKDNTQSDIDTQDSAVQSGDEDGDGDEDSPEEVTTPPLAMSSKDKQAENNPREDGTSDIHVKIESVEISLEDLQAQNYVVPVMITLDENAGISYAEWGALVDSRCTFTADNSEMDLSVYYSINEEQNFMWTAWSSGSQIKEGEADLLKLEVTLPQDAAVGDKYEINYQSISLAEKPHSWSSNNDNWVTNGYVTWTDGGITIIG
ncbi:MAG: hypothetical protein K2H66_00105 [Oscillospiraceae bacterium]|nr:hypothetical protein [Oscillospiraceae bacterium]MDE6657094.1 hypothetical protein [Oscillospiraceae bacterium]